jgi:hypothetical protein
MARTPDKIPSERVRIDGYLKRGIDPQVDALLAWLDGLPRRQRFPMVMRRLMMGGVIEAVVEDGNVEAARIAAREIMAAFVVED